jgi:hypothetical protein
MIRAVLVSVWRLTPLQNRCILLVEVLAEEFCGVNVEKAQGEPVSEIFGCQLALECFELY